MVYTIWPSIYGVIVHFNVAFLGITKPNSYAHTHRISSNENFGMASQFWNANKEENSESLLYIHIWLLRAHHNRNCRVTPVQLNFHVHPTYIYMQCSRFLFVSFQPIKRHTNAHTYLVPFRLIVYSNIRQNGSERTAFYNSLHESSDSAYVQVVCSGCLLCCALHQIYIFYIVH